MRLLQSTGLSQGCTVVDLGTGTGQFALAAAEVRRHVVAVDPSPFMVRVVREKAHPWPPSLEIVRGGFLTYEHGGEPPVHHVHDVTVDLTELKPYRTETPRGGERGA